MPVLATGGRRIKRMAVVLRPWSLDLGLQLLLHRAAAQKGIVRPVSW